MIKHEIWFNQQANSTIKLLYHGYQTTNLSFVVELIRIYNPLYHTIDLVRYHFVSYGMKQEIVP